MLLLFIGNDKKTKNPDKKNNGSIYVEQYFHIHLTRWDSRKGNSSIFRSLELIYKNFDYRLLATCDCSKKDFSHFVESDLIAGRELYISMQ
jgi:hypothetical protein